MFWIVFCLHNAFNRMQCTPSLSSSFVPFFYVLSHSRAQWLFLGVRINSVSGQYVCLYAHWFFKSILIESARARLRSICNKWKKKKNTDKKRITKTKGKHKVNVMHVNGISHTEIPMPFYMIWTKCAYIYICIVYLFGMVVEWVSAVNHLFFYDEENGWFLNYEKVLRQISNSSKY